MLFNLVLSSLVLTYSGNTLYLLSSLNCYYSLFTKSSTLLLTTFTLGYFSLIAYPAGKY